jgi:selT/selW/selH-like putative selenoprotein
VRSSGGVFEVTVGNEVLFSKKKVGRFPMPGEVEEKLSARTAEA